MKENIKELIKLIQENPDLPVIPMVESEAVNYDFTHTVTSFGKAYVEEYAVYGDGYYSDRESFKEDYYDCHDEELCERFNYNPRLPNSNEENNKQERLLDEYLDGIVDQYFKKAIVVYIHPYEEE